MGNRPTEGDLVVTPETPLSGVHFIEVFGRTLRRSIDHVGRYRHITLGALAEYEVTVPQQIAIESGLFESNDKITVYVENGLLNNFIFYSASISYGKTGRPCYPYVQNEATLISMIDELLFLDAWVSTGYATELKYSNGRLLGVSHNTTIGSNVTNIAQNGIGCGGCTAGSNIIYDKPTQSYESVHHIKPDTPPGLPDDKCFCNNVYKPGTIILDPVE